MTVPELSVTDAVRPAWDRMKDMLFRPFSIVNWLTLSFVSFLDALGQGQAFGLTINFLFFLSARGQSRDFDITRIISSSQGHSPSAYEALEQLQYLEDNLVWVILAASGILLVIMAVITVLQYIGTRGTFIYIDNVVRRTADIPWQRSKKHAMSFFLWKVGLSCVTLILIFLLFAAFAAGGYSSLVGESATDASRIGLIATFMFLIVIVSIASAIVSLFLHDMVAPIMYYSEVSCTEAWRVFLNIARANVGQMVIYVFIRIGIGIMTFFATLLFSCTFSCVFSCITGWNGTIPVVYQMFIQPILLFNRAFPLFVLGQAGGPFGAIYGKPAEGSCA